MKLPYRMLGWAFMEDDVRERSRRSSGIIRCLVRSSA